MAVDSDVVTRLEAGDPGVWFVFTQRPLGTDGRFTPRQRPVGCVEKTADGWVPMEHTLGDAFHRLDGLYAKRKDAIDALLRELV